MLNLIWKVGDKQIALTHKPDCSEVQTIGWVRRTDFANIRQESDKVGSFLALAESILSAKWHLSVAQKMGSLASVVMYSSACVCAQVFRRCEKMPIKLLTCDLRFQCRGVFAFIDRFKFSESERWTIKVTQRAKTHGSNVKWDWTRMNQVFGMCFFGLAVHRIYLLARPRCVLCWVPPKPQTPTSAWTRVTPRTSQGSMGSEESYFFYRLGLDGLFSLFSCSTLKWI